eukprot:COSAG05_NODE_94_length_19565_cov_15.870133_13_plen_119_part_00
MLMQQLFILGVHSWALRIVLDAIILLLPVSGGTVYRILVPSYGEVWARRNVVGLSRPCRHRRVGIATRGLESERCIGAILGAAKMCIRKFGEIFIGVVGPYGFFGRFSYCETASTIRQ